ncbi:unnamed protein product [Urochloa humidicola]
MILQDSHDSSPNSLWNEISSKNALFIMRMDKMVTEAIKAMVQASL